MSVFFTLAGSMIIPIYAIFVKEIGGDILSAGKAYAIFALAAGLLTFMTSRWENHIKHIEKVIVLGYLLGMLGYLGHLFVKTPLHLFLVQILLGFSAAILNPAYDMLHSKYLEKDRKSYHWGIWEAENLIAAAVASLTGAYVVKLYGFKTLLTIMFLFSLFAFLASLSLLSKRIVTRIFSK